MFRTRQPLRKFHGCGSLSHVEFQATDDGVRLVTVNDCEALPPVSDYDLELNLRSGENLKEVSSIVLNHGRVNLSETTKEEIKTETGTKLTPNNEE